MSDTQTPTAAALLAAQPVEFEPLDFFYAPEYRSHYMKGMRYTIKDDNAALAEIVARWVAEGRVRIVPRNEMRAGTAKVTGTGVVS